MKPNVFFHIVQVVDVMKDNMEKVLDRDVKLTHLENRAGNDRLDEQKKKKTFPFSLRYVANERITIYDKRE